MLKTPLGALCVAFVVSSFDHLNAEEMQYSCTYRSETGSEPAVAELIIDPIESTLQWAGWEVKPARLVDNRYYFVDQASERQRSTASFLFDTFRLDFWLSTLLINCIGDKCGTTGFEMRFMCIPDMSVPDRPD